MKTYRSVAKVNLHLEVVRRRADGYHELRTVFRTLDLADQLRLDRRRRPGIELAVSGAELPADRRNLAFRAAEEFHRRFGGDEGVRIEIEKRIPVGGGLGGGSSNAATTLLALALGRGWDPFSPPLAGELSGIAAELGSDVPFFLVGGTAVATGRGERLLAVEDPPAGRVAPPLWLAVPPFGSPTAEVYAGCEPRGEVPPFPALGRALAGEAVAWTELLGDNDLEAPAFARSSALGELYTAVVRAGAKFVRMSGSGSVMFALFEGSSTARRTANELPSGCVWLKSSTLDRGAWRRSSGFDPIEGGS